MKNNKKIIISILIVILVGISIITVLSLNGTISFKNNDIDITDKSDNVDTNDEVEEKEEIDYSKFVGEYVNDNSKGIDDVRNNGGVILKILSISEGDISFEIESVSSNQRIAYSGSEDISVTSINDGVYSFKFNNDGWNSTGIGSISIISDKVYLSVETLEYSEDNTSGWSLGNFNDTEMYLK